MTRETGKEPPGAAARRFSFQYKKVFSCFAMIVVHSIRSNGLLFKLNANLAGALAEVGRALDHPCTLNSAR
jgi:hypothetical protein